MDNVPPSNSNEPPYVCVDLSAANTGDIDQLKQAIEYCGETGVDAVNLPLYRTDHLISLVHREAEASSYRKRQISREEFRTLEEFASKHDLTLSGTVFDPELLEWYSSTIEAPFVVFHGGDITYRRLLEAAAGLGKTPLLSTAAARENEIQRALKWVDHPDAVLLHNPVGDSPSLRRMNWLADAFDHRLGLLARTDRDDVDDALAVPGSVIWIPQLTDLTNSVEREIDQIESRLERLSSGEVASDARDGTDSEGPHLPTEDAESYRKQYRRSLMASESLSAGDTLNPEMVREMRPSGGLPAETIRECNGIMVQRPTDPQEMIAY